MFPPEPTATAPATPLPPAATPYLVLPAMRALRPRAFCLLGGSAGRGEAAVAAVDAVAAVHQHQGHEVSSHSGVSSARLAGVPARVVVAAPMGGAVCERYSTVLVGRHQW